MARWRFSLRGRRDTSTGPRLAAAAAPREVVPLAPEAVVDFAEVDPESGTAVQLSRTQWKFLTAVDGQMPLWAVCQKLNAPEPTILRLAAELVAAGTIVIVGRYAQVSE